MPNAIILAAGRGERLVNGFDFPKPLKRVCGVPLIVRVLRSLERSGVRDVAIVTGYLSDVLEAGVQRYRFDLNLSFVHNDEWEKPNGTSLLKAADHVRTSTFLMMSDHLWSPSLLSRVGRAPINSDEAVLGIDYNISRCFDLPDATKVRVADGRIVGIGKELDAYDALDTGVFRITPALIDALRSVNGSSGCSLSEGVAVLARQGKMRSVDVRDAAWIDVDTPASHAHAERLLAKYGDVLQPVRQADMVMAAG
jgi:1L-myo-inositol 1-phosphate cytidylyltransferase